jgi:hypothetical protein
MSEPASPPPARPMRKLNIKAWLCFLRGDDVRSKTATEEFKNGPKFHVEKSPPLAFKPRRKPLGPKQLRWLRKNIESFRDLEAITKASKEGIAPIGSKAK